MLLGRELLTEVEEEIRRLSPAQADRLAECFRSAEREMGFEESHSVAFLEAVSRHHSALMRREVMPLSFYHAGHH